VVRIEGEQVYVAPPAEAMARYVAGHAEAARVAGAQLAQLAEVMPLLAELGRGAPQRPLAEGESPISGRVSTTTHVPNMLVEWIHETAGQLCFLRPDQWRLPSESAMAAAFNQAVQSGRRVRAIYPMRALQEAPAILVGRAAIGEQIRLLPEVPSRLAVVGTSRAVIPDPLGVGSRRVVVIEQQSIVELVTAWFDHLWDSAATVPMLDRGEARPDLRRLLLAQLAAGAKDEQIARTLNISLRTVRRRIAALMADLGVDTRFQAGVEATRRGWL